MVQTDSGSEGDFQELVSHAERVVATNWGGPVHLEEIARLSQPRRRNLLLRLKVLEGPTSAPASVMLKRARLESYNPDDPKSRPAIGLFREWAGLEFLGSLNDDRLAFPKFYGGDRAAGFLLMEDLGATRDLDHVLTCGAAEEARRALVLLAETLGRMHAQTAGRSEQYQQIRDALGPGDGLQRRSLAEQTRDYAPVLAERCGALGVAVTPGFFDEIESVATVVADPGELLTYTHCDACPDNCVLAGDRLCLIDYEFGSFRHALLDGVYGRLRFPTCWCVRDIPEPIVVEMESIYRRELVKGCPSVGDDAVYFKARADACAYWILENLAQLFDRALEYEEPKGTSTNRHRILTRLAAFTRVAEQSGHLEAIRQTFGRLLDELRRRWRDNMPLYDAFRLPGELDPAQVGEIVEAVRAGQVDRVHQLLDHEAGLAKAKASDADQTPLLYLAVEAKSRELVQLLLQKGADWRMTTRTGWTVLARACSHSTPDVVDMLLEQGAELNDRDAWGALPLYGAVNNPQMLAHLLGRGAKLDVKAAMDLNRLDVAELLLRDDPSRALLRFGTGVTLLHDAARVGDARLGAMQLLLRYGAEVNALTNWNATPLHLAAFNGHLQTAVFLLDHGADLEAQDHRGSTPLALAEGKGHARCAELLRRRIDSSAKASDEGEGETGRDAFFAQFN